MEHSDPIDLQYLRDLLAVLNEAGVAEFAAGGFTVRLNREPGFAPRSVQSLDTSAVETVEPEPTGWAHPSLWAASGGKRLTFDGSLR